MVNRIKDLREDHDLTQQQLAAQLVITQRKYSYIETGTQPLTAEILVKTLSMRPDKLQTITTQNFRDLAKDFNVVLPEKFLF